MLNRLLNDKQTDKSSFLLKVTRDRKIPELDLIRCYLCKDYLWYRLKFLLCYKSKCFVENNIGISDLAEFFNQLCKVKIPNFLEKPISIPKAAFYSV